MYKYQNVLDVNNITKEMFEKRMQRLEEDIVDELVNVYGKSSESAGNIVTLFDVWSVIEKNPHTLKESASYWATMILITLDDIEALENYLSK